MLSSEEKGTKKLDPGGSVLPHLSQAQHCEAHPGWAGMQGKLWSSVRAINRPRG